VPHLAALATEERLELQASLVARLVPLIIGIASAVVVVVVSVLLGSAYHP